MDQIGANRMSPAHVPPGISEGVMLIKEVIFALVINHTIRVIHEVFRGSKVKLWSKNFSIMSVLTSCNRTQSYCESKSH